MLNTPSAESSEQYVIGALLIDGSVHVYHQLNASQFSISAHQVIFQTCLDMTEDKKPVSVLTVSEELKRSESKIGPMVVNELASHYTSSATLSHHISEVQAAYTRRQLLKATVEMRAIAETEYDPEEALGKCEQLFRAIRNEKPAQFDYVEPLIDEVLANMESSSEEIGIRSLELKDLDQMIGGFHAGNLIIIAGRPGDGKTSLGLTFASEVAEAQRPVLFITMEMTSIELTQRLISMGAKVPAKIMRTRKASNNQMERIVEVSGPLSKYKLCFDARSRTLPEIQSSARRMKADNGLEMLVIDYLQLINGTTRVNRNQQISEISKGIKSLAMELQIPILCLSQLSRASDHRESKKPRLSDLRDSGAIEQDADVVLFIHNSEEVASTQIIIGKNRHGEVGEVEVRFDKEWTRFTGWGGL